MAPFPAPIPVPPATVLTAEEMLKTFVVAPGFKVELGAAEPMISTPVAMPWDEDGRLWHGAEDRSFAPALAEATAREIPGCTFRLVPGVGHYSLPIRHARESIADLFSIPLQPAP